MDPEDCKVSVWVCREEKVVLGLSRRTSCADVVKVLLENQNSTHSLSLAQAYCIVEKWRGFERTLPNKTKILRLWMAWGEERRNVKFVLVKSEASMANPGARSSEARVVPSKQNPCATKESQWAPMSHIPPEKQRRIVRKAFRKLEKMNKKRARAAHKDAPCAEKMETLVHLVVSQDHTIRQQVQRITELDAEIERCEAKVHFDRIKRHGVNYVQNTYLVEAASGAVPGGAPLSTESCVKFEEYVLRFEELVGLQEELREQEDLIDRITEQIQEELNNRWMRRRDEELRRSEADAASTSEPLLEGERIKTQLDASLYIGLRLNTDLEAIRSDLELTQQICEAREREMRDLMEEVNTLAIEDETGREQRRTRGWDDQMGVINTLEAKSEWVEQARGLSKAHSGNDDDSDTGLSSLHSQDSDSLPVWESLV